MVSFQRPLLLRFFKMRRPFFVESLARNPEILITFLREPFKVCFDII